MLANSGIPWKLGVPAVWMAVENRVNLAVSATTP